MNNLPPGPCPTCGQETKPLFNTYYCDCDRATEKTKIIDIENDTEDYNANLRVGGDPSIMPPTPPIIHGVQMKYWFKCPLCQNPAFYLDREAKDIHPRSQWAFPPDGVYQRNYPSLNLAVPACDSCNQEMPITHPLSTYLYKY